MKETIKIRTAGANQSYIITIPKKMIKKLDWIKGQKVVVELKGKRIILRDWKKG